MSRTDAGRYLIEEQIGSGGMATVYRALDSVLQRSVAVKVLHGGVAESLKARFQAEAQAVAQLNHPNVVSVYDVGESDGNPYIVMEYVEGTNLKRLITERGSLTPEQAIAVVTQIGAALSYAHRNGLIHCDVKPHNILLSPNGRAKLVDFGIAQAQVDRKRRKSEPQFGTPLYIAPEQAAGRPVSPSTDVYGLGLVLWEALTGMPPERPVPHEPVDLDTSGASLPAELGLIIHRATAAEPSARYSTVDEFLEALVAVRGEVHAGATVAYEPIRDASSDRNSPTSVRPTLLPGAAMHKTVPLRRQRRFGFLPAAVLALLLLGLGGAVLAPRLSGAWNDLVNSNPGRPTVPRTVGGVDARASAAAAGIDGNSTPIAGADSSGEVAAAVTPEPGATDAPAPATDTETPNTAPTDEPAASTNTPSATDTSTPVEPTSTPMVAVATGERVAQVQAQDVTVKIDVVEDGKRTKATLQPGEYREFRASRELRILAGPSRDLLVTLDGGRPAPSGRRYINRTLHSLAEQFSNRDLKSSSANIVLYGNRFVVSRDNDDRENGEGRENGSQGGETDDDEGNDDRDGGGSNDDEDKGNRGKGGESGDDKGKGNGGKGGR